MKKNSRAGVGLFGQNEFAGSGQAQAIFLRAVHQDHFLGASKQFSDSDAALRSR